MEIRKKLYLIILASILATAVPGGALMYAYTERHMLQAASADLDESTHWFANTVGQKLLQGEPKLRALAQMIEQALSVPIAVDELLAFAKTAERNPDGVWRNRRAGFDGTKQSGVFLPDTGGLTDWQKVQHLRIKRQMDDLGAATNRPGENLWYLSPQRSEIIFDRAYPNFAFEQKAENDYTQTPWVTLTSPTVNPQRRFGLTPPLYDPVPGVWMVSAVLPLYAMGCGLALWVKTCPCQVPSGRSTLRLHGTPGPSTFCETRVVILYWRAPGSSNSKLAPWRQPPTFRMSRNWPDCSKRHWVRFHARWTINWWCRASAIWPPACSWKLSGGRMSN